MKCLAALASCCLPLTGCIIPIDHDISTPIALEAITDTACVYSFSAPVGHGARVIFDCKASDRGVKGMPNVWRSGSSNEWLFVNGKVQTWQNGHLVEELTVDYLQAGGWPEHPEWGLPAMAAKEKGRVTIVVLGDVATLMRGRSVRCTYASSYD